jgi:hypothetical protein
MVVDERGCGVPPPRVEPTVWEGRYRMPAKLQLKGEYELFETTHHHRILSLNGEKWFALVKGKYGDILVHSDSDHRKDHTIQKGEFFLADFEDDPKFVDQPHLFLEKGDRFQEWVLPEGLATERNKRTKLVIDDETIAKDELEKHLGKA